MKFLWVSIFVLVSSSMASAAERCVRDAECGADEVCQCSDKCEDGGVCVPRGDFVEQASVVTLTEELAKASELKIGAFNGVEKRSRTKCVKYAKTCIGWKTKCSKWFRGLGAKTCVGWTTKCAKKAKTCVGWKTELSDRYNEVYATIKTPNPKKHLSELKKCSQKAAAASVILGLAASNAEVSMVSLGVLLDICMKEQVADYSDDFDLKIDTRGRWTKWHAL